MDSLCYLYVVRCLFYLSPCAMLLFLKAFVFSAGLPMRGFFRSLLEGHRPSLHFVYGDPL